MKLYEYLQYGVPVIARGYEEIEREFGKFVEYYDSIEDLVRLLASRGRHSARPGGLGGPDWIPGLGYLVSPMERDCAGRAGRIARPVVGAVIVSYGPAAPAHSAVQSLLEGDEAPQYVVVVNNGPEPIGEWADVRRMNRPAPAAAGLEAGVTLVEARP